MTHSDYMEYKRYFDYIVAIKVYKNGADSKLSKFVKSFFDTYYTDEWPLILSMGDRTLLNHYRSADESKSVELSLLPNGKNIIYELEKLFDTMYTIRHEFISCLNNKFNTVYLLNLDSKYINTFRILYNDKKWYIVCDSISWFNGRQDIIANRYMDIIEHCNKLKLIDQNNNYFAYYHNSWLHNISFHKNLIQNIIYVNMPMYIHDCDESLYARLRYFHGINIDGDVLKMRLFANQYKEPTWLINIMFIVFIASIVFIDDKNIVILWVMTSFAAVLLQLKDYIDDYEFNKKL